MIREYRRATTVARRGGLALGATAFCTIAGGIAFYHAISRPPDGGFPIVPIALLSMAGVSALQAWSLLRTPARIGVDIDGLHLFGVFGRKTVPWASIARLERDKFQESARAPMVDVLLLRDDRDRPLARVLGGFEGFPELVHEIEQRSTSARGTATYDRSREMERKRHAQKKERRLLLIMSLVFMPAGLFMIVTGGTDLYYRSALEREGVRGEARIVRRYTFNVTPKLDLELQPPGGGAHARDVAVEQAVWDGLDGAATVPVLYLPSKPERYRLVQGELDLMGSPAFSVVLGLLAFGMSTAGLVLLGMGYAGLESKDGRVRMVRLGEVDDRLERPR